jgi:ATP-dependent protease ClpP protease subunit
MTFFNLANHDPAAKTATVQIMDQIGYNWWTEEGTEAKDFMAAVRELGDLENVSLEINSPGGNVHEGVSIANFIKSHPANWTAKVVGNAASIASVIACACDTVEMGVGTNFLVHKPSSLLFGMVNADDARDLATNLDVIETSITEFYQNRIESKGKTNEELDALMREDRYMTADEAIEWGFADSRTADLQAVACADTHMMAAKNFFASQISGKDGEIKSLRAKIEELENTASSRTISLSGDYSGDTDAFVAAIKDAVDEAGFVLVSPDVNASKEQIITAFQGANLADCVGEFLDLSVSADALADTVESLSELKDICAAKDLDFLALAKNAESPANLVATALNEFEALSDDEIDNSHKGTQEVLAKQPSYDGAYAQFNQ